MEELFSNIWSIIAALLVLSVMVMVHEAGHFSIGRLFGFGIEEFAIGMGPKLFGREKNGTLFSIRAFPIGGMCRFVGEDEVPKNAISFNAQKPWKRFLVVFAGPFFNVVFAVLFAFITLLAYGSLAPMVDQISTETGPAAVAGMQPGDILLKINGERVDYTDAVNHIVAAKGPDIVVTVERGGEELELLMEDVYNEEEGRNIIGIVITRGRRHFSFFGAFGEAFHYIADTIGQMFEFFGMLFQGQVQQGDVMGPVGTISFISYAVRTGFEVVLHLAVLLSVNLAIINLLPLPALDGGRLIFIIIEMIRRKPISQEKEGMVHFIGIILLFGLIIFLSYQDILACVQGGGLFP